MSEGKAKPLSYYENAMGLEKSSLTMNCPRCGSADTKTFEMIHKSGTSALSGHAGTIGISGDGGIGFGSTRISGTQTTSLAAECKPPAVPVLWPIILIVFMAGVFLLFTWYLSAFLFVGSAIAFASYRRASKTYPDALAKWKNQALCARCGSKFSIR